LDNRCLAVQPNQTKNDQTIVNPHPADGNAKSPNGGFSIAIGTNSRSTVIVQAGGGGVTPIVVAIPAAAHAQIPRLPAPTRLSRSKYQKLRFGRRRFFGMVGPQFTGRRFTAAAVNPNRLRRLRPVAQ
jgi:hypothetical protein